jgi:hypothetical protein
MGGTRAPYLLLADSNVRLGLDAPVVAHGPDLSLFRPGGRYAASWTTRGVDDNGRPLSTRRPIRLTVYGRGGPGARRHTVALAFAGSTPRTSALTVRAPGVRRRVTVAGRRLLSLDSCVPAGASRTVTVSGGRPEAVRLVGVRVLAGPSCRSR